MKAIGTTLLLGAVLGSLAASAASTIDPAHPCAYAANLGWLDARGLPAHGASVGAFYCSGFVWSANAGWISLGQTPANGWRYSNASATDWGVNHDGEGRLSGQAWGANIGWITFEQSFGLPRVDLRTGFLSGSAWSANAGWISLSNVQAVLRSASLDPGPDTDADGIPDPWEFRQAGALSPLSNAGHDEDGDGVPDVDEAAADTDPFDGTDFFRIVSSERSGGIDSVLWSCRPSRLYRLEAANGLVDVSGDWPDVGGGLLGPPAASPARLDIPADTNDMTVYRIRALPPISSP